MKLEAPEKRLHDHDDAMGWVLACPSCRTALHTDGDDEKSCAACGVVYRRKDGIWRLLAQGRSEVFRVFVEQYESVRRGEGRLMTTADRLRALPFRDVGRQRSYEWHIRSRSFQALVHRVVQPLERRWHEPLRILDLGSGLGWLAYRLTLRGHRVAAVDLVTNGFDGLGVHRHYDRPFLPLQAEFDRLPLEASSAALVIYNAAFHYATDYASTLREAFRVLGRPGTVVIMDSPIYRDRSSGLAMVRERENDFERHYGFRGNAISGEGFLTYERLAALEGELGLRWEIFEPWYGVRWWLKPRLAKLRRSREPARFKLIVGRRERG